MAGQPKPRPEIARLVPIPAHQDYKSLLGEKTETLHKGEKIECVYGASMIDTCPPPEEDTEYKPKQPFTKPPVNKLITKADLPRVMQPHHWRHLFSGGLSFVFSVAVGVVLSEVHHRWPREVHWQDGTVEKAYKRGFAPMPTNGVPCMIGVCDDGTCVWKEVRKQSAERIQ